MHANDAWFFCAIEVAGHGIAEHGFQSIERIGLSEDGVTQGASFIATLWRFVDFENDFVLWHVDLSRNYTPDCGFHVRK